MRTSAFGPAEGGEVHTAEAARAGPIAAAVHRWCGGCGGEPGQPFLGPLQPWLGGNGRSTSRICQVKMTTLSGAFMFERCDSDTIRQEPIAPFMEGTCGAMW